MERVIDWTRVIPLLTAIIIIAFLFIRRGIQKAERKLPSRREGSSFLSYGIAIMYIIVAIVCIACLGS